MGERGISILVLGLFGENFSVPVRCGETVPVVWLSGSGLVRLSDLYSEICRLVGVSQGGFVVTKGKWIENVVVKSIEMEVIAMYIHIYIYIYIHMSHMGRERLKRKR